MKYLALVGILAGFVSAQSLPDNDGRATLERVCGSCHGADIVIGMSQTKDGWTDVVNGMKDRGATGSEDDFKQIVDYLVRNFGPKPAPAKPAPKQ